MSLPLVTLPHIINSSLAMALLTDLLPRLTHSNATIRKKTIVTLYRFALVYPETLRPAWPKIKERLMDENEDPSVTAAIVNVVCELGWRRPQDFLPLAPRLFDLLVEGGNNWMAIKIIKLVSIRILFCFCYRKRLLIIPVCNPYASRAKIGSKASSAFDFVDTHDTCNVPAL